MNPLRVDIAELLRQPGTRREVSGAIDIATLGLESSAATARIVDGTVHFELVAESTMTGITVRGAVELAVDDECRRCLQPVERPVRCEVDELYQSEITEPDANEMGPDSIDLVPLVRDLALLALDEPPPLCREDCAGICAVCGADLNAGRCDCDTAVVDERWSALDQVVFDDDPN